MKDQYIGDIGDYGKYGLLHFLSENNIVIGINWYLTDQDGSNDGKFTDYLEKDMYAHYDSDLFVKLKRIAAKGRDQKCVQDIENESIIPGAIFFRDKLQTVSDILKREDRIKYRGEWHNRAKSALLVERINLIFADPDNGSAEGRSARKGGEKYAELSELREYYDQGKNVVYYCHKARRKENKWEEKRNEFNNDGKHKAKIIVLTFHRGTQRSYIFAIHPNEYEKYNALIDGFMNTSWGFSDDNHKPMFTREQ